MSTLINILNNIGEFFTTLFDVVVKIVTDIIYVIELLGDIVKDLPDYLFWLPSTVIVLIMSIIAIAVIYKILGRS